MNQSDDGGANHVHSNAYGHDGVHATTDAYDEYDATHDAAHDTAYDATHVFPMPPSKCTTEAKENSVPIC